MCHYFITSENISSHPHHFEAYWKDVFDTPISWLKIFSVYESSCATYFGAFQLELFSKILPTRKMLKTWKTTDDNIRRFCADDNEDIMHLFWYCPVVALFWQQVADWVAGQQSFYLYPP